jgi:hypothetical protein
VITNSVYFVLISLNKEVIAVSRRKSCYTNHTVMFYNKLIGFSNNKNCLVHLAGSNLNTNSEINEDKKVIQELSRAYKNKMIYKIIDIVYITGGLVLLTIVIMSVK